MKRIINLDSKRRELLFETTAREMKISSVAVEKDFWVCVVLNYLMNESKYKDYFIFKGGTSLSKCYDVINRFSEDIDLVLKWDKIGFLDKDVFLQRSKNQDYLFETKMNKKGSQFVQGELKQDLVNNLSNSIPGLRIDSDPNDSMVLLVYYPSSYKNEYIQQAVRIEIGPVAAKTPNKTVFIEPYCYKFFNADNKSPIAVNTITIQRTFWEKVLILYVECNRPNEKKTPIRYSRHFYDVYMIYKSNYINEILEQKELFEDVKKFKTKYYRTSWSNIENCFLNNIKIVPNEQRLKDIADDYKNMKEMLFGNAPLFDEVVNGLKDLECKLKTL